MTPSGMFACVQMILFGTLLLRVPSVVNAFTIHSGARNFIISGEHEGRFVQHENSGSRISIRNERMNSPTFLSSTSTGDETNENEEALPEPASMRIRAIKDELNDAGVSSSDCFDKDSLVERLVDARSGKVTGAKKEDKDASAPPATSEENTQNTSSATKEKVSTFDKDSFAAELRSKKVRELRTLCAKNNIRWATMIEKEELVNALVKHQEKAADFSPSGKLTPGKVSMIDDDILSQEVAPGAAVTPLLLGKILQSYILSRIDYVCYVSCLILFPPR